MAVTSVTRPARRPAADPPDPPAPDRRGPGERCELCGEPISDEHGHLVDLQARNLMCACRGCYLLSCRRGPAVAHFRAVPDRYLAFPDFELSPAQWDSLQIPVSVAFFFLNSHLGRVAAFYPGPAGATESELPLDTWAEVVEANPELATLQPDVEAFLVRLEPNRGGSRVLHRPDRRLLRAGRPPAHAVAGLRRRQRGQRQARRLLRRGPGQGADDRRWPSRSSSARAEPHAAVPTIMLRLRVDEADGGSVHALALRCQIRIEPQRRRYSSRRGGAPLRAVRRDPAVGRFLAAVPVDPRVHHLRPVRRRDRVRPAGGVHLRLRGGRRQVPARPGRGRDPADPALLGHRVHPGRDRASRPSRCRGTSRRPTSCRCRSGAA